MISYFYNSKYKMSNLSPFRDLSRLQKHLKLQCLSKWALLRFRSPQSSKFLTTLLDWTSPLNIVFPLTSDWWAEFIFSPCTKHKQATMSLNNKMTLKPQMILRFLASDLELLVSIPSPYLPSILPLLVLKKSSWE